MSHRFSLALSELDLGFLGLDSALRHSPQFNIAPRTQILLIRADSNGQPELTRASWGLVPPWLEDLSRAQPQARSETLRQKPMFRQAFAERRCLILCDGYYTWREHAGRTHKHPYRVCLKGGGLFAFAGLWERYPVDTSLAYDSCALITVPAPPPLDTLNTRMPLILEPARYRCWLNPTTPDTTIDALLRPIDPRILSAYPVSPRVNDPTYQGPDCHRRQG